MKLKNVFGLKSLSEFLTDIYMKWSEFKIIAGDLNIDLSNGNKQSQSRYKTFRFILITSTYNKSNKEVKNIVGSSNGVIHHDILHTENITDHDFPYVIFNIKKRKVPTMLQVYMQRKLLLNLTYSFDDSEDLALIFNKLVADCINTHAPLRKLKLSRL